MADGIGVVVLLFASVREKVGRGKLELRMCEGSTTSDLLAALAQQHPALAAVLPSCALSVNRRYLSTEQVALSDGDEIAVIPPVSGG
ncbi:hypothetical protein KFE25_002030 [Diacronema lutheri]|uniref:Molybdopterin synthase sulfur carrier subunit n=1 Tax=Diacronema lutheri TaxID=2081491 RepID=A0A8J5XMP4_DIALT|nr:hypothetical protein KFE25_002030 [Diacronema lutheri]